MPQPESFIVRVLRGDRTAAGVGALIGDRHLATCAHVVNTALGREQRAQEPPEGAIHFDFPLLPGGSPALTASVETWVPPPTEGAAGDDIAGLRITGDLPRGAMPARLAVEQAREGREVEVFGYPGTPKRSDGAWVRATVRRLVGNGRLQIDSDSAIKIQPGFSGGPVYDASGMVVGLIGLAPDGALPDRDSYATTAERLRLTLAGLLAGGRGASVGRPREQLMILHVSDLRFTGDRDTRGREARQHDTRGQDGQQHDARWHDARQRAARDADDPFFGRLHADLADLAREHDLRPDILVVTGNLAAQGRPSEFRRGAEFIGALAEAAGIPRRHVAIVPGDHDVNRQACMAYFAEQESAEDEPVPPYWPKWKFFARTFADFYQDAGTTATFTPDEPFTLFEMPGLNVVVAGLNSTIADSHRDEDHYGWIGAPQHQWFNQKLVEYRERGWLRVAAVHHGEPRDTGNLDRALGTDGLSHLLLHAGVSGSRLRRLPSGLVTLSTGGAQYQIVTISRDGLTRHARCYESSESRWVGDTRISATGSDWRSREPYALTNAHKALAPEDDAGTAKEDGYPGEPGRPGAREPDYFEGRRPRNDFLDRVEEATRVRLGERAIIVKRPDASYLRVTVARDGGAMSQWPIGTVDGVPDEATVDDFAERVHSQFAAADPSLESELVHGGPAAPPDLVSHALRRGIRLKSFAEYQGLVDLSRLVEQQRNRLADDRLYPERLYVEQRYRIVAGGGSGEVQAGLVDRAVGWIGAEDARIAVVLGDFGRGKTSFLRQLTRVLPARLPRVTPVLIELRELERGRGWTSCWPNTWSSGALRSSACPGSAT